MLARRFLAPQEQGGDARPEAQPAVPAFSAFGPMETRARPMSREHGRCRCARSTLFALRGKSASELARLILICHGRKLFAERSALQGLSGRRAGRTEAYPFALHEAAESPQPSRGENGGLCPHPLKGFIP